jgi:uncharacterized membrane protein
MDKDINLEETDNLRTQKAAPIRGLLRFLVVVVPLLIIALGVIWPPLSVLDKTHFIGYGICHQIPERTFFFNGQPMPLCARCSGTYLGALLGFVGLLIMGRRRAGELPPPRVILMLVGFIVLMGIDGVNSYLSFFPAAPQLYEPRNLLRLITGSLNGLALSLIVYPVFNFTLWRHTERRRSIEKISEVLLFLPAVALLALIVTSGVWFLLYPLSILSTGGVLVLLTMVNTMIVLIVTQHESLASNWREAIVPIIWGLAVSLLELSAMIAVRTILTQSMGLPF